MNKEERTNEVLNALIEATREETAKPATDGKWLEGATVEAAKEIQAWELEDAWKFEDRPDELKMLDEVRGADPSIDCVGLKHGGGWVAIQCKSVHEEVGKAPRMLPTDQIERFKRRTEDGGIWAERWVITNGNAKLSSYGADAFGSALGGERKIHIRRLLPDLLKEKENRGKMEEQGGTEGEKQNRDEMQEEAVATIGRKLRACAEENGGKARGKVILPCGSGKTRIAARAIAELLEPGEIAAILCPSRSLVRQIIEEVTRVLQGQKHKVKTLPVSSDSDIIKKKGFEVVEDFGEDDTPVINATGRVRRIAEWMKSEGGHGELRIIVCTYQSSHRLAEAQRATGIELKVMVCDEAHRTAGIGHPRKAEEQAAIRRFCLCHHDGEIPAKYRIYQTATPKVYSGTEKSKAKEKQFYVEEMDDIATFGQDLYRRTFADAVSNGWLTDYKIIAYMVRDEKGRDLANKLAEGADRTRVTEQSALWLRALSTAMALGGEIGNGIQLRSILGFANRVPTSKQIAEEIDKTDGQIREWLKTADEDGKQASREYTMIHLDASHSVARRAQALQQLRMATKKNPVGVMNVGLFGEGTDVPSLDAVAFIEPRQSPVQVVQAVGRAMRHAPDKPVCYIICPLVLPPGCDAERYMAESNGSGWKNLAEVLLALRAHDERIEDGLRDKLEIWIPPATPGAKRVRPQRLVILPTGEVVEHWGCEAELIKDLANPGWTKPTGWGGKMRILEEGGEIAGSVSEILMTETRALEDGTKVRHVKSAGVEHVDTPNGPAVLPERTWKRIAKMKRGKEGRVLTANEIKERSKRKEPEEKRQTDWLEWAGEIGERVRLNVLEQSGLQPDRAERDANLLRDAVRRGARYLKEDNLEEECIRYLGRETLTKEHLEEAADPCTVAALTMLYALMLQRKLETAKNKQKPGWINEEWKECKNWGEMGAKRVLETAITQWEIILKQDYAAIVGPARDITAHLYEKTGQTGGLGNALKALAARACEIAEHYGDAGIDHAGPLLNGVMGDRKSDGAFFTRPVAALMLASLALDAYGEIDWTNPNGERKKLRVLDPACGSGTMLTAMNKRMIDAVEGARGDQRANGFQKTIAERLLTGLDINRTSLQMAAAQLVMRNTRTDLKRLGLHELPYGNDGEGLAWAGTLEILNADALWGEDGVRRITNDLYRKKAYGRRIGDERLESIEHIAEEIKGQKIVLTNPPFTSREKMGSKYREHADRKALHDRVDEIEAEAVRTDATLKRITDKNSVRALFVALAEKVLDEKRGVLGMVCPTAPMMSGPAGARERKVLAERFHVQTIVTCHDPNERNMSDGTGIHESLVVCRRAQPEDAERATRLVALDRFPRTEKDGYSMEAEELCEALRTGNLSEWGEISWWPRTRIKAGNWRGAIWRNPQLAELGEQLEAAKGLVELRSWKGVEVHATGQTLRGKNWREARCGDIHTLRIVKSKAGIGEGRQERLEAQPDYTVCAIHGRLAEKHIREMKAKRGHLLITAGQRKDSGRLQAVGSKEGYVGGAWMPVTGVSQAEAEGLAIWWNGSAGRVLWMNRRGKALDFPVYSKEEAMTMKVPPRDICTALAETYRATKNEVVPCYQEGYGDLREIWDEEIGTKVGGIVAEVGHKAGRMLAMEPAVSAARYQIR